MKQHRYNMGNKKNDKRFLPNKQRRAIQMFKALYTPADVCKQLKVSHQTSKNWYSIWIREQSYIEPPLFREPFQRSYWQTEEELIESFNPVYKAEDLTGEEKAILLGKVSLCRI